MSEAMNYSKNRIFRSSFMVIAVILLIIYGYYADGSQNAKQNTTIVIVRNIGNDLLQKIQSGKYKEVEDYFNSLVKTKQYSIDGSRLLEEIYLNLSYRRGILKYLDKWCSQTNHHSAFIVRGMYYVDYAWGARGEDWAYTVSKEQFRLMRERFLCAKEDLEKAYVLNPRDPNSAGAMISVCMGLGLDEGIMEGYFQNAMKADPIAYYAYRNKFLYLAPKWRGTHEKFSQFAEYCYRTSPTGSRVYTILLEYLYECAERSKRKKRFLKNQNVQKTLNEILERWLKDFPNSTSARVWLAIINEDLGNVEEAIKYCGEVLAIEPNHRSALRTRGDIYFRSNEDEKAEKDFKKLIEIDPYDDYALFTLGRIAFYHYKAYQKSIEYYDKAIELNSTNKYYFYQRGIPKFWLKNYGSSKDDFSSAIQIDPKLGIAYYNRGRCLWYLDEKEKAKDDFRKAKYYNPSLASRVDRYLKGLIK